MDNGKLFNTASFARLTLLSVVANRKGAYLCDAVRVALFSDRIFCPKIFEQMSLAVERKADRIWVLNVGDLKPYEMDTEFFIALGWDASIWNPANVNTFVTGWAQREFDVDASKASEIATVIANVTRFNSRRKPELLNSTTYSLTNYRE